MNTRKLMGWLVLGGLALFAMTALADYNVQNKGTYYNNASTGLRTDSQGRLLTSEALDLGTQTSGWLSLLSSAIASGGADSSAIQTAYSGYVLHGLQIRASLPAVVPSATNAMCRVAVSVRTHLNDQADSTSTTPVQLVRGYTVAAAGADSIVYGRNIVPTSASGATGGVAAEYEFVVTLYRTSQNATSYGSDFGRYIPISDIMGNSPRLKNFSVRVRVLGASANTNTITVNAYATMLR